LIIIYFLIDRPLKLHQYLASKTESRPVSCEYAGGRFRLNEKGLSFIGSDKDGNQLPPRWVCSSIKVVAKTRDAKKW